MAEKIKIYYICDKKKCEHCAPYCEHTTDIEHSLNRDDLNDRLFEYLRIGDHIAFFEKEVPKRKNEFDMDIIEHESLSLGETIG